MAEIISDDVKLPGAWPSVFVMRDRIALNIKSVDYAFLEETVEGESQLLSPIQPCSQECIGSHTCCWQSPSASLLLLFNTLTRRSGALLLPPSSLPIPMIVLLHASGLPMSMTRYDMI